MKETHNLLLDGYYVICRNICKKKIYLYPETLPS